MDDDLLNIPRRHPDASELRPKTKTVQRILRHADTVWVSTAALAAGLAPLRHDATVVPNGLDERLWCHRAPEPRPVRQGSLRILCMGTSTHDGDFAIVQPALERLRDDFGDCVAVDMLGVTNRGDLPPWINRLSLPPNASLSYPGFVNWITGQPPWDIGLAPLTDTPFNRCKSPIKTLDYAALGLAVLASDIGVYRGSLADGPGGMLVPNETGSWYAALSWLLRNAEQRRRLAQGARDAMLAAGTLATQSTGRRRAWHELLRRAKADRASAHPSGPAVA
jgi:glycosyltransferase involved in cell wall biosynthesis